MISLTSEMKTSDCELIITESSLLLNMDLLSAIFYNSFSSEDWERTAFPIASAVRTQFQLVIIQHFLYFSIIII